ncbi:unnamed protein product [Phytophthora fragariaefolia]|uniref:Unnamed protein product n=1 Tax=Phytophthora fragariaefolia TaxID=1490495 RepID=A0A9W6TR96_9STRA|nr:unnamed protein product [Phytophthora fragariaefolia]
MVAASSANAASGTPSGGGSAAPSVSSAPPDRNNGRSSSDKSEEEEVEWQLPGSKEVSKTTGAQAISVDRATALQTLGVLPTGQGSSSGMPVVVEIPPGEPSDITIRVVGVPATESHNDGRAFLQDGFGGLEALVQMEGATELAVLYDFFDDNDIIGDFILTPRETPLTATELSSQLKNIAVKRELSSILSQFDSKQLALRTFGTVSLLRKVAAKHDRIKRKLAEADGAASVIELQDEFLRLKRDQQFHSSYWFVKVAEVQRERNAAVAQMRSDFVLLMEERERDISSLRSQVQTLKGELDTTRAPRRTVITVMASDNLAFQAPQFVRIDPPQDEDDEETKECDPPAPDFFLDLSRSASTTKFRSRLSQLGKRASGSQSPKSNKKQAPDGAQELPSEWVSSTSPCRPEEVGVPGYSDAGRGRQVPSHKLPSGRPHHHAPVYDALASFGFRSVDEVRPPPVLHGGFGGSGRSPPDGDPHSGVASHRRPSLDDGEIDLLESEDEAEDKTEKDEDYNPHQDQDDGVDDEDEVPDEASDDEVLNVAQRTTKRRRLSQSSADTFTPPKTQDQVASQDKGQGRAVKQVQVGVRIVEEAEAEVRRFQTPELKHRYCSCGQGSPASGR